MSRATRLASDAWHVTKEACSRIPNPARQAAHAWTTPPKVRDAAAALRRDGIAVLEPHVGGELLRELQAAFVRTAAVIKAAPEQPGRPGPPPRAHTVVRDYSYYPDFDVAETLNPFRFHPSFAQYATDPFLRAVAERYWGRRCMLSQFVAVRYEPSQPTDFGSFGWHHDSYGKRMSAMLLLTDVGEDDQPVTYVKKTHRMLHPLSRSYRNWSAAEMRAFDRHEHVKGTGKAGTVILFDPNGLHRANRGPGAQRDVVVAAFCPGYCVFDFAVPRAVLDTLDPDRRAFLLRNPRMTITDDPPLA